MPPGRKGRRRVPRKFKGPAFDESPPGESLFDHSGPSGPAEVRCIDPQHPLNSIRCRCAVAPRDGAESQFSLVGDPGKRNGEKRLRALLARTPEWNDPRERCRVALLFPDGANNNVAQVLRRKDTAGLRKLHLLVLCRVWGYASELWTRNSTAPAEHAASADEGTGPETAAGDAGAMGAAEPESHRPSRSRSLSGDHRSAGSGETFGDSAHGSVESLTKLEQASHLAGKPAPDPWGYGYAAPEGSLYRGGLAKAAFGRMAVVTRGSSGAQGGRPETPGLAAFACASPPLLAMDLSGDSEDAALLGGPLGPPAEHSAESVKLYLSELLGPPAADSVAAFCGRQAREVAAAKPQQLGEPERFKEVQLAAQEMSSLLAFWIHHRSQLAGWADAAASSADAEHGTVALGIFDAEEAWADTMAAWAPVGQMLLRLRSALCASVAKTRASMPKDGSAGVADMVWRSELHRAWSLHLEVVNRAVGLLNHSQLGSAAVFRTTAAAAVDFLAAYADTVRSGLHERLAWLGELQEEQRRSAGAEGMDCVAPLSPAAEAQQKQPAAEAADAAAAAAAAASAAASAPDAGDALVSADAFGLRSTTPAIDQGEFLLLGCAANVAAQRDNRDCGALLPDGADALGALLDAYTDELQQQEQQPAAAAAAAAEALPAALCAF